MKRAGFSLIELVFVLVLLAILLGMAAPPLLRNRDAAAVRAARDDLAAALAWTRLAAAAHGGATLSIPPSSARYTVETAAGGAGPSADLADRYGVELVGTDEAVRIHYDRLGLGRLANRTIEIRRGAARARLVISAYGRVRRW